MPRWSRWKWRVFCRAGDLRGEELAVAVDVVFFPAPCPRGRLREAAEDLAGGVPNGPVGALGDAVETGDGGEALVAGCVDVQLAKLADFPLRQRVRAVVDVDVAEIGRLDVAAAVVRGLTNVAEWDIDPIRRRIDAQRERDVAPLGRDRQDVAVPVVRVLLALSRAERGLLQPPERVVVERVIAARGDVAGSVVGIRAEARHRLRLHRGRDNRQTEERDGEECTETLHCTPPLSSVTCTVRMRSPLAVAENDTGGRSRAARACVIAACSSVN